MSMDNTWLKIGLRDNPKRAQLLISTVLGKHINTTPTTHVNATWLLAANIAQNYNNSNQDILKHSNSQYHHVVNNIDHYHELQPIVGRKNITTVFSYAETATGLGAWVAYWLGAHHFNSTRKQSPQTPLSMGFNEPHSHASQHNVYATTQFTHTKGAVVLVDDEITTGTTFANTIRQWHQLQPRTHYICATLTDARENNHALDEVAQELKVQIDVVSLHTLPAFKLPQETLPKSYTPLQGVKQTLNVEIDKTLRYSSEVGLSNQELTHIHTQAHTIAEQLHKQILNVTKENKSNTLSPITPRKQKVLILGTEEFTYTPSVIAYMLETKYQTNTHFASTTRSPVKLGGGIEHKLSYYTFDGETRWVYNIEPGTYDTIVVISDTHQSDLTHQLTKISSNVLELTLPQTIIEPPALSGPNFGSYEQDAVTWLLKDLSHVELEADINVREKLIQSKQAHYAESLPIEYQPDDTYLKLFHTQLQNTAPLVATSVGTMCEIIRHDWQRDDLVLVSLARAGVPIGILAQEYGKTLGHTWPHYAISIVRGRGIDVEAMKYLSRRYDPTQIVFIDGWTGKGAISKEIRTAIEHVNQQFNYTETTGFNPHVAVLADPGGAAKYYGTREDFLIPSACLNSTVSGLISRTVLNTHHITAGEFHGAKYYRHLQDLDVSQTYIDTISPLFNNINVKNNIASQTTTILATNRQPNWWGWQACVEIAKNLGHNNIHLIKPGVGETTRVLLRRMPEKIIINPQYMHHLQHILHLAQTRGVDIEENRNLPYASIGIIKMDN